MATEKFLLTLELPPPLDTFRILPPFADESFGFQRGVLTPQGVWLPLLNPKGYLVFQCYKRHIALSGSRYSSKTLTAGNRMMRHLWEVNGAIGGIIAKTLKNAKAGTWRDMVNYIIPGWCAAGFGMKVLAGPKIDPVTRMEYIILSNRHGGKSELQLHSLDYEWDVEAKFKSTRFSCVWLCEADQFEDRIVYDILEDQLRVIGLSAEDHHFLFDCNPPVEGEDHWLHELLYKAADPTFKRAMKDHDKKFDVFEFGLDDNYLLDPQKKIDLKEKYQHDSVKYARFVEGRWVRDSTLGHFDEVFVPNVHIVGKVETPDRNKWEVIVPQKQSIILLTGTDIGTLNHATGFIAPRHKPGGEVAYDIFDEVCSIKKKVSVAEFATMVWERIQKWNEWFKKAYNVKEPPKWIHFCDSSLFNYNAGSDTTDANIFLRVSNGAIKMRFGKDQKKDRAVWQRVGMCKRLFFDNRLFISAQCEWNIRWARFLKPGRRHASGMRGEGVAVMPGQMEKHPFDGSTYAIGGFMPFELEFDQQATVAVGAVTLT